MDDLPTDPHGRGHHAHVVVHPPVGGEVAIGYRRVDILGTNVGNAYRLADVVEFMRSASLEDVDVEDPQFVEWQGDGPDVWE